MKRIMVPLLAGLAVFASNPSWAWSKVSGSITSVDQKAHQIALNNGKTYTLQGDVRMGSLAVGDKVTVTAEAKAGKNIASRVTKVS